MLLCPAEIHCQVVKPFWSRSCICGLIGIITADKLPTANVAQSGATSAVRGNVPVPGEGVAGAPGRQGDESPTPPPVLGHPGQPLASHVPASRVTCHRTVTLALEQSRTSRGRSRISPSQGTAGACRLLCCQPARKELQRDF